MAFREKVKRAFHRSTNSTSSSKTTTNSKGMPIKIEYYKRHEIPRSKFKGPFDPEHQKRLAAWNFEAATADRPRSMDLSLSPCATVPDYLRSAPNTTHDDDMDVAPDQVPDQEPTVDISDSTITITHDEYARNRQTDTGSESSTAVDPDSYSGSMMTLLPDNGEDTIAHLKETIRYTSPAVRASSPLPMSKGAHAHMPFSPDDLSRALHAVQICS